jgi:hypothetical protein
MTDVLGDLERQRAELLRKITQIGYFRPGSISALVRPCGKPRCRCSEPGDPGHGPNLRLTYKVNGRTRSESLANAAAVRNAQRQIARFRKFQQWSREFTEVNADICRLLADRDKHEAALLGTSIG